MIDRDVFLKAVQADRELLFKLRALSATIRFDLDGDSFDLRIEDGDPVAIGEVEGNAAIVITAPRAFWEQALVKEPARGFESLSVGGLHGAKTEGPFHELVAPYQGALQRLFVVLRETVAGPNPRRQTESEPYRDTDCAVGRYVWANRGDQTARVYYEEAGTGAIPLILQHTAGADGRQHRHILANPALQKRFRMISWDLPYHGKSMPPVGERWWEDAYRPSKEDLMQWSVAICEAIGLDQPIFLGTSVGGQLALDLAAHHADCFRAFVSVNGWYEARSFGFKGDLNRHPRTSTEYFASRMLASAAPMAPEGLAQEVYWVYRSNVPGVYAGDNDYFMNGHDLREDGHLIDAFAKPVWVVAGEYDASTLHPKNGGQAVADNIPGIVYRELPGLGHFAPSDDPVGFCEAIVPILDEIVAKSG